MQAPQATLDLDQAKAIGLKLKAAREALQLPASKVANMLLLSSHQVESLEAADAGAFYNARFYAQAADKYAGLMQMEPVPSVALLVGSGHEDTADIAPEIVEPIADQQPNEPVKAKTVRKRSLVIFLIGAGIAVAIGMYLQRVTG